MAEKKKAKAVKPKKGKADRAAKPSARKATAKPANKAAPKPGRAATRPRAASRSSAPSPGFDIARLIDHPLVADLLAVGALAAVAAIAAHHVKTRTGEAETGSSRAVKAAGAAAASAIGRRLMTEVDAVRKAAGPAKAKPGSK